MQKYSFKKLLIFYLLFSLFIGYFVTYIVMSFLVNPNYNIAFIISTFCSFFGSLLFIIPSIVLYIRVDKVKKQAEINYNIDSLTQLLSRKPFSDKMRETLVNKSVITVGIIFIDLDHFKIVNDTYGHLAGDEVMIKVGKILSN
jgi:predicted signal transduction protein with EAL and GGDEF domain